MRGSSGESFAQLTSALRTAVSDGADASALAGELFAIAGTLRHEPALRRVATDASVAADAKQGLVKSLFGERVSPLALDLLSQGVASRWIATRDLPDSFELLGEMAVALGAGDTDRLADELFEVRQLIGDNPDLRDALSNPLRSRADKESLLRQLLEGKVLPATLTLTIQGLAGTYRTVGAALDHYQEVVAEVGSGAVATVQVAVPLTESERDRLAAVLARDAGRPVHLNEIVDPSIIGGIRIEIGDQVIDGTIATRLDDARRKLAS